MAKDDEDDVESHDEAEHLGHYDEEEDIFNQASGSSPMGMEPEGKSIVVEKKLIESKRPLTVKAIDIADVKHASNENGPTKAKKRKLNNTNKKTWDYKIVHMD